MYKVNCFLIYIECYETIVGQISWIERTSQKMSGTNSSQSYVSHEHRGDSGCWFWGHFAGTDELQLYSGSQICIKPLLHGLWHTSDAIVDAAEATVSAAASASTWFANNVDAASSCVRGWACMHVCAHRLRLAPNMCLIVRVYAYVCVHVGVTNVCVYLRPPEFLLPTPNELLLLQLLLPALSAWLCSMFRMQPVQLTHKLNLPPPIPLCVWLCVRGCNREGR